MIHVRGSTAPHPEWYVSLPAPLHTLQGGVILHILANTS